MLSDNKIKRRCRRKNNEYFASEKSFIADDYSIDYFTYMCDSDLAWHLVDKDDLYIQIKNKTATLNQIKHYVNYCVDEWSREHMLERMFTYACRYDHKNLIIDYISRYKNGFIVKSILDKIGQLNKFLKLMLMESFRIDEYTIYFKGHKSMKRDNFSKDHHKQSRLFKWPLKKSELYNALVKKEPIDCIFLHAQINSYLAEGTACELLTIMILCMFEKYGIYFPPEILCVIQKWYFEI